MAELEKRKLKEDICRIQKKDKVDKIKKIKRVKYHKITQIKIPKVYSNYKNPKNELIPLEIRQRSKRHVRINVEKLIGFNKLLDQAEEECKRNK